jgi:spore coat protein H
MYAKNIALTIIPLLLLATSCYKEVINQEPGEDRFDMLLSSELHEFIYSSRDTSYTLEDPALQLTFNDQLLEVKEIRVRGKSALDYRRKSYAVFLNDPIPVVDRYGSSVKNLKRFKLLALAADYTYIENRIAFGILQEAGVMPLFFKFVEFRINGETQGVYMLMEDPEEYYKEIDCEFILRRGYNHHIDDIDYAPSLHYIPQETYEKQFYDIYSLLVQTQGEPLFQALGEKLDLESYFRKIGIDYLVQNGDYTDELYLYSRVENDIIQFRPIPWDYDDIFASQPHEIGRSWGMGTIFGIRYYGSMTDVYDDIGQTMVYSIEDDLDYTIARDPLLYSEYKKALVGLLAVLNQEVIERIFRETEEELTPFYNSISVIEQSVYDQHMTTKELWKKNMVEKQQWLVERLLQMQEKLGMTK